MKLNGTALAWINAVNEAFQTRELTEEEESLAKRFTNPTNTKGSEA